MKMKKRHKNVMYRILTIALLLSYSIMCSAQYVSYYQVGRLIKQISLCLVPVGAFMVFWEMQHGGDARKCIIRVVGGCAAIGLMYYAIKKMYGV